LFQLNYSSIQGYIHQNELEIEGKFNSYFFFKSDFKYFFFLKESDSVALYFSSMVILLPPVYRIGEENGREMDSFYYEQELLAINRDPRK
jgi:hypothetical protein